MGLEARESEKKWWIDRVYGHCVNMCARIRKDWRPSVREEIERMQRREREIEGGWEVN